MVEMLLIMVGRRKEKDEMRAKASARTLSKF
jgi:hypothetical protein